jgi:hypothetical protein
MAAADQLNAAMRDELRRTDGRMDEMLRASLGQLGK